MPTNVVKTPRQEHLWEEAKSQAKKEGKSKDWAYIMGIFKKMGGLDKTAGFVGTVLGKNVGAAKGEVNALKSQIQHTKDTMNKATGLFGKRKFSDSATRKAMKEDYEKLRGLKSNVRSEQMKTFGARTKTLAGAGAIGGAAYSGNKLMENRNTGNNDEFKPQYLASQKNELIEKIAMDIIKEASVGSKLKDMLDGISKTLKAFPGEIKDTANLSRYKEALRDYNALHGNANSKNTGKTVRDLLDLRKKIEKLQTKTSRLSTVAAGYKNNPRPIINPTPGKYRKATLGEHLDYASSSKNKMADRLSEIQMRNRKAKNYSDLAEENKRLLETAGNKYRSGEKVVNDMHDIELSKVLGLYGGGAGLIGAGTYKGLKKSKNGKT